MAELGVAYSARLCGLVLAETERLPEPLRGPAEAMDHGTADERRAAASEFIVLSGEWLP